MEVICLEDDAFYALVNEVVSRINTMQGEKEEKWLTPEQAMIRLGIKSKTTLQKLRDENAIRFSKPGKRIIMYDNQSIDEYLDKNANSF
ncbi:MAG: helix-turn-helix domain-containing protein [Flavipsychrobacter sp.]